MCQWFDFLVRPNQERKGKFSNKIRRNARETPRILTTLNTWVVYFRRKIETSIPSVGGSRRIHVNKVVWLSLSWITFRRVPVSHTTPSTIFLVHFLLVYELVIQSFQSSSNFCSFLTPWQCIVLSDSSLVLIY